MRHRVEWVESRRGVPFRAKPTALPWVRQAHRGAVGSALAVLLVLTPARPARAAADAQRAAEVMRSVQQRFWDDGRHRYATDAARTKPAEMWACGIAFSALDAAARAEPAAYRPVLSAYFNALDRYWDRRQPLGGYEPYPTDGDGDDKYYDDNAWMAITFAEAYAMSGNPAVLARARATTDFVLSGWDDQLGGGIWWHEKHKGGGKNTCVNAPGAVGCLRVAQFLPVADAAIYRKRAVDIVAWTREHLQNPNGLYADNVVVDTGHVARFSLTYNTALMIRANLMLWRQTGQPDYRVEAEREARAADAFLSKKTGAYRDEIKWAHLQVEADLAVARATTDAQLAAHVRQRARATVDANYAAWSAKPSDHLIDVASLARELYLMAEDASTVGRAFWAKMDGPRVAVPPR